VDPPYYLITILTELLTISFTDVSPSLSATLFREDHEDAAVF
jgi:hypothetical protein